MTIKRKKPRRRLAAGQRCHCCHCGKRFEWPNRSKNTCNCPHCNEVVWSPHLTPARLKRIAWTLLSRLKRWSCADERGHCTCITCGTSLPWQEMQAGHFVRRRYQATVFEWDNVQPQCTRCNTYQDGEQGLFALWLRDNLGPDVPEALIAKSRTVKQWKRDELILLIEGYRSNLRAEGLPDR